MDITAVILCGGSGTRLWPLSRSNYPKQFLRLFSEYSLFQEAVLRVKDIAKEILIVTSDRYYWIVENHLKEINIKANIITEPAAKNTAPAIALATYHTKDNDSLLIIPSDHRIENKERFQEYIKNTYTYTKTHIITFGISPTYPETGYGYIKLGDTLSKENNIYKIEKFVEKPSKELAQEYINSGKYLWNSGMFFASKELLINEFKKIDSTLYDISTKGDLESFKKAKALSFDYAIMEHTQKGACAKLDIKWSDVGSWLSVYEELKKDENNNAILGENYISINSDNNLIISNKRLVGALGLKNLIIVDTEDATLIVDKNNSQDVKKIVDILKAKNDKRAEESLISYKPYGYYVLLEEGKNFKIRKLLLKPKKHISKQMHHHRTEHWIVLRGTAKVLIADKEYFFHENESFFVPKSTWHYIENPGIIDLEMLEVQSGEYLEETDTIREDVF
ncbi:mannose-1-phosphate guanylyltransferase/mannose-6-phosphate isomerase [Hydrogenobaculum sp. Y04AAS1]|uniref:mannose-1-phosphate guanylyltransferase/mannose-6-phosphate isomerase n=1 Tax=Hydrogenobaculum sp. (strain Y04AAS1) TaxID=380749 RepID=UPI00015BD39E|nr:mannose-1-phosphate guanylyltransferase/mannose-6-phosphate isomerase [Hydrogenobaculum sp. Y04AAS1]HCT66708.1 mannose-1-phosphate guanylyltransferase/mannose-6-phosphate isomerase [Hydrogenobaculum sp.]